MTASCASVSSPRPFTASGTAARAVGVVARYSGPGDSNMYVGFLVTNGSGDATSPPTAPFTPGGYPVTPSSVRLSGVTVPPGQPVDDELYRERGKKVAREGYVQMSREYIPSEAPTHQEK